MIEIAFTFDVSSLRSAIDEVRHVMPATPAYRWPLLEERIGLEMWVKHENHAPTGAFKVRGGITYFNRLRGAGPLDVICATRGNHGQSVAFNAARIGVRSAVVVPHGNSQDKNNSMRALGAEVIEYGGDFQESLEHAKGLARERGLHMVESFHPQLVRGVATAGVELFDAAGSLDAVYAPIGLGSGLCGLIAARDALGLSTETVGVVAQGAQTYARSMEAGHPVEVPVATVADGMAVRLANADALAVMRDRSARFVLVSDGEIEDAVRLYFTCAHNVAEPAGAASLAAALQDAQRSGYRRVGVILSGGNVDRDTYVRILSE